jgi:hypothetical protein
MIFGVLSLANLAQHDVLHFHRLLENNKSLFSSWLSKTQRV